jgi:CheY-like chemotaxis protein
MDAATLARAGQPFFTTKALGAGTGLGLPMAKGFADQSGGGLSIRSSPGKGTVVELWLPQATSRAVPAAAKRAAAPVPPNGGAPRQSARILVVDDEMHVRDVLATQLEEVGYDVLVAPDGSRALALIAAGEAVDLLVTDLSMPGMNGFAVIRAAQQHRPGLPAILLTGYAGDSAAMAAGGSIGGSFLLLRKPIPMQDLVDRIQTLLAAEICQETADRSALVS